MTTFFLLYWSMVGFLFIRDAFDHQKQRVACVAHIIHLAVQELLGPKGLKAPPPNDPVITGNDDNSVSLDYISGDLGGFVEEIPNTET